MKTYALVGRRGDDGGRYLASQHRQMKVAAWRMAQAGDLVQVWLAAGNGDLLKYDGEATRRVTDYIVKGRAAQSFPDHRAGTRAERLVRHEIEQQDYNPEAS